MKDDAALDQALESMHLAFRAITAQPDRILGKRGLGRAHHRILYVLARHPGISLLRLIEAMGISRQALHRPLAQLIAQQLVRQRPDDSNRRIALLTLTAQGASLEKRISGLQREYFAQAFEQAGPQAMRHWYAIMKSLSTADAGADRAAPQASTVATLNFR